MIRVTQTKLHDPEKGVYGNCYAACLACLLEIPISDIPPFEQWMDNPNWVVKRDRYLRHLGMATYELPNEIRFDGYTIGLGFIARQNTIRHAVIYKGLKMVHDPMPGGQGLVELEWREMLVPYNIKR